MALTKKKSPAQQTTAAAKKVGKALSAFTEAAEQLEIASAEHLAVAEQAYTDAQAKEDLAFDGYEAALKAAAAKKEVLLNEVVALEALGEANEDAAFAAQQNADSLRGLLAVA